MKFIFIVISLFFASVCTCQINIINRSLTDSSINIFYIGVDNAIELKGVKNEAGYLVFVTRAGSQIRHEGNRIYLVRVHEVADTCILKVYNKNGKKVFERNYKTQSMPSAVLSFAGQTDTTITISRILANPSLNIIFPGCYLRVNYRISSFKAEFAQGDNSTFTNGIGNAFSAEQVELVKTLKPKDKIFFDEIYAVGPDSRRQHLPSFWIKIE